MRRTDGLSGIGAALSGRPSQLVCETLNLVHCVCLVVSLGAKEIVYGEQDTLASSYCLYTQPSIATQQSTVTGTCGTGHMSVPEDFSTSCARYRSSSFTGMTLMVWGLRESLQGVSTPAIQQRASSQASRSSGIGRWTSYAMPVTSKESQPTSDYRRRGPFEGNVAP